MIPRLVIFGLGVSCSLATAAFVAGAVIGTAVIIGTVYGRNTA